MVRPPGMNDSTEIAHLLSRVAEGDPAAWDELLPRLYATLHEIAHRLMHGQPRGHTLQTTALVHEAYLKMAGGAPRCETRLHFERVAARAMRTILVDHARARNAQKRGEGGRRVMLTDELIEVAGPQLDVLALHEALEKLQKLDPETAEVAEMRCFGGLQHDDIARVTGRSTRTVERAWRFARSWIENEMEGDDG